MQRKVVWYRAVQGGIDFCQDVSQQSNTAAVQTVIDSIGSLIQRGREGEDTCGL